MLYPSYRHCSAQHRRGKLDLVHRLERGDVVELDVRVERGREHPGAAVGEAQRRHCLGVRGDAGEEAAAGQQVPELDVVPAGRGHEGIVAAASASSANDGAASDPAPSDSLALALALAAAAWADFFQGGTPPVDDGFFLSPAPGDADASALWASDSFIRLSH